MLPDKWIQLFFLGLRSQPAHLQVRLVALTRTCKP
jgi:hypothetical protein